MTLWRVRSDPMGLARQRKHSKKDSAWQLPTPKQRLPLIASGRPWRCLRKQRPIKARRTGRCILTARRSAKNQRDITGDIVRWSSGGGNLGGGWVGEQGGPSFS